jgi:hypothetical protein
MKRTLASTTRLAAVKGWRAVEAQHVASTLRLVDNHLPQQELLERILEESKPPLPAEALPLHYLLASPFRYPPSPKGSRFRAWPDPGVLYAGEDRRTACAEMGYWRWRFLRDSDALKELPAAAQTVFSLSARGPAIDLRETPWSRRRALWTDPRDYTHTQAAARLARENNIALLRYESVRDPEAGGCFAVFAPTALQPRRPHAQETWMLTVTQRSAIWQRERDRFVFDYVKL